MKPFRTRPKLHVYQRIILVFIAMFIPVCLINLTLNLNGLSYIKKLYSDSESSNVSFYAKQLNAQLSFIRNLQYQFVNDSDMQRLSFYGDTLPKYEQLPYINRISERLRSILNSSDYLRNVGVYLRSIDMEISTEGGGSGRSDIVASFADAAEEQSQPPVRLFGNRLYLVQFANNGSIVSYVELSRDRIEAALGQLTTAPDSGSVLVDDSGKIRLPSDSGTLLVDKIIQAAEQHPSDGLKRITDDHKSYSYASNPIYPVGLTLYTYTNQNELTNPLRRMNAWFVLLAILSLLVVIVYSVVIHLIIHKPLKELIAAFKMAEENKIDIVLSTKSDDEFGYLYRSLGRMVNKLRQSIRTNYEQSLALSRSEFKQLQSQINPHFLYNSFYNLYMMCKAKDYDSLAILTQKLGSYYQFITRSGADEVPFHLEY